MNESLTIIIPINDLYYDAVASFFQRHGCTIERLGEERRGARLYRILLPQGTERRLLQQAPLKHYRAALPDGTLLDEVKVRDWQYSYLADVTLT